MLSQPILRLPGDLNFARAEHTATLLPNGNVLVAGGTYWEELSYVDGLHNWLTRMRGRIWAIPVTNYLSCEMYNAATHTWSKVGSLVSPRVDSSATLLENGQVLVAGGCSSINGEVFDPVRGSWHVTGRLGAPERAGSQAILMVDGEVLLAGGATNDLQMSTDLMLIPRISQIHDTPLFERYNAQTNAWKTLPKFNFSFDASAIILNDGMLLIAGGWDLTKQKPLTNCYLYDPIKDTFRTTGALLDVSQIQVIKLANGKVLSIGDKNCEIYDPITEIWTRTGSTLSPIYSGSTATLLHSGQVLLIISSDLWAVRTSECELYDPQGGTWSRTGKLKTPRTLYTSTCLKDGRVLVVGGVGLGKLNRKVLSSCELYDPATGTWGEP